MADPQPVSALNASDRVLQCFWDLASVDEEQRVKAAQQLVLDVMADQQENKPSHIPPSNAQLPKAKQLEHALRKCSPVMTYALRRLARGVGSGRAGSRQGYATALSVVLAAGRSVTGAQEPLLTLEDGMVLLESCIDNQGGGKGGDAKDALLGKLFGLSALIRAGLVTDAAAASTLITSVLSVGTKKSFLREAAVSVVLELLLGGPVSSNPGSPVAENGDATVGPEHDQTASKPKKRKAEEQQQSQTEPDAVPKTATSASARWVSDAVVRQLVGPGPAGCEALRKFLTCSPQEASPEALLLALCLWPYLPEALVAVSPLPQCCPAPPPSFVTNPNSVPHAQVAPAAAALMSTGYLKQVLPALQSTTASSPRLHQLWSHLLPYLLPGFTPQQQQRSKVPDMLLSQPTHQLNTTHLTSFWNTVVEEGLFESSHERKYLGFQLFLVMLPRIPASAADIVFSKNFSRTLTIAISKPESLLHAMAKKVLERVKQFLAKSPDAGAKLRVAAALQRLGQQGAANKATAGLMEGMDEQGVRTYCQQYMDALLNANDNCNPSKGANGHDASKDMSEDEHEETAEDPSSTRTRAIEKLRATAADQLVAALKFPAMSDAIRLEVLQFLAASAFFKPAVDTQNKAAANHSAKKKAKKAEVPVLPAHIAGQQTALQAGASPLSEATRSLCAQRLIAAVMHAPSPVATSKEPSEDGAQQPPKKKQKGNAGQQQQSQADASRFLAPVCRYVKELHSNKNAAALAVGELPETVDIALQILRELEGALEPLANQGTASHEQSTRQSRARVLLQLVQLLQLYVFGDPANTLDTALFIDLRRAAKDAVELEIEDMEEQEVSDEDEEMIDAKSEERQANAETRETVADTTRPSWSEVLLDVLLSLLSRPSAPLPSAPLRSVCEAVWRATCEGLTAAGVQDLLRIVVAGDQTGSADDEEGGVLDDDREDEDEDEVEMEVRSDSDDESIQEANGTDGSSDDDEQDKEMEPAVKNKRQEKQNSKPADEGSDDDSESDGDGADDAEMFKMDSKIAAYMRAVADKKKTAREAAAALSALKFRALSLLEVFARKAPSSPLLLLTLLPLIKALSRASRAGPAGNTVLSQRLSTLVTKCICKAKPTFSDSVMQANKPNSTEQQPATSSSSSNSLEELLNRLLYLAARADIKSVAEAAGAALALVFRSTAVQGLSKEAQSVAEQAYTATIKDYLCKKKSRLSRAVMEGCCSRAPHLAVAQAPLAALLKEAGGAARNGYKQTEAIQLLLASVKAASSALPQEDVFKLLKPHAGALGTVIESAAAGVGMKPAHHAEALKACTAVVEVIKKVLPAARKLAEMVGPEHLRGTAKAVVTVREIGTSEKVNTQLSRLAQVLGATELLHSTPVDPALRTRIQKAAPTGAQKQEHKQPAEVDVEKAKKPQKGSGKDKREKEMTTKDKRDNKKTLPKKEKKAKKERD